MERDHYLANLEGATYRITSQRSEGIDFYCNPEETDSQMFAYIKFLYDNICLNRIIVSPNSDVAVISLYQSLTNFTFLDALWFKTGIGKFTFLDALWFKIGIGDDISL